MPKPVKKLTPFEDGQRRRMHMTSLNSVAILPGGRGANPGATATFLKADKSQMPNENEVQKGLGDIVDLVTSINDDHQHGVNVDMRDGQLRLWSTFATSPGQTNSHDHQFFKNENGSYAVLQNQGHTHDDISAEQILSALSITIVEKTKAGEDVTKYVAVSELLKAEIAKSNTVKEAPMPNENENENTENEVISALKVQVENLSAITALSGVEKTHYDSLSEDDRAAFLKMDSDARSTAIKAADIAQNDADPVVYKSATGEEFRASDDQRVVAAIKLADEQTKKNAELVEKVSDQELARRADELIPNVAGDLEARKAMLKAAESIPNEVHRTAAIDNLRAMNSTAKAAMNEIGTTESGFEPAAGSAHKTAHDELMRLAKEYADKHEGMTPAQAYIKVSADNPILQKHAQLH